MPKAAPMDEVRALTDEQLAEEIMAVKKELFELRLQKATKQLNQPHLIRQRKHRLAQLLMVEGKRKQSTVINSIPSTEMSEN
jgi:large subunit ribosomal protein L29